MPVSRHRLIHQQRSLAESASPDANLDRLCGGRRERATANLSVIELLGDVRDLSRLQFLRSSGVRCRAKDISGRRI